MPRETPMVVVLTGGIASGKTAVSDRFAALGVPVIDTDLIARELVLPGAPLLDEVVGKFGSWVLDSSGALDRSALRRHVFSNPAARRKLEALLHPAILSEARKRIDRTDAPWCLVVVPLLAETGSFPDADRVLLVEADTETRIERIMARDRVDRVQAMAAIAAQASDAERRAVADEIIDNSGNLDSLQARVANLNVRYSTLAANRAIRSGN